MKRSHVLFAMMIAAATLTGCAEPQHAPGFYVPTTMMYQPATPNPESATALAYQVLPAADDDISFVGRGEKAVYTALPITEVSAFTFLTYDAQRISGPTDSGYRYTWMVRQGIWVR
jgi:hypothetical protein